MHPQNLVGLKDLMAHIFQKFGPEAVILEVVQDPGSHDQGCGCMECMEGRGARRDAPRGARRGRDQRHGRADG